MGKILIGVEAVMSEETPLIILKETGILYTAQCGGIGCTHPQADGYVLGLGKFAQDFDDCAKVFSLVGPKWSMCYGPDDISMEYYPNGICATITA